MRNLFKSKRLTFLTIAAFLVGGFFVLAGQAKAAGTTTLNVVSNPTNTAYYNAVVKGADRLLTQQNSDGGWPWQWTGTSSPSDENNFSITAIGLLNAYQLTHKTAYLNGATLTAEHLVAKPIPVGAANDAIPGNRFYSSDIEFLMKMAQVTGNTAYSNKATALMTHFMSEPNRYCASGCATAQNISDYYHTALSPYPGFIEWDLAGWVEAAKLTGQTEWGTALANIIKTDVLDSAYAQTLELTQDKYYSMGLGSAIEATSLFSIGNADIQTKLLAEQNGTTGAIVANSEDGVNQTTAYSVMGLSAAGDSTHATLSVSFLTGSGKQNTDGGWTESNHNEYTEVNSEIIQAIFSVLPANTYYTIQDAINAANSGDIVDIAPGTYAENVEIFNKPNITIQGRGIDTIIAGSGTGIAIKTSSGITIKNLKIHTVGANKPGIWVYGWTRDGTASNNLIVQDTTIIAEGYSPGIVGDSVKTTAHSNWLIGGEGHSNTIQINDSAVGVYDAGDGIDLQDVTDSVVSYNNITIARSDNSLGYGNTNVLWSSEAAPITNLVFNHNNVNGSAGSQVAILTDFNVGRTVPEESPSVVGSINTVTVSNNTFDNWGTKGLRIGSGVNGVTVTQNKFLKTGLALRNEDLLSPVNAANNYWGTASSTEMALKTISDGGVITYTPYFVDADMHVSSAVVEALNTVHTALEAAGIANNLDTCALTANSCTGLYFEKSVDGERMGRITFNSTLDLTNTETQDFLTNLGTRMDKTAAGVISLDFTGTTASTTLKGVGATIKFYGLDKLGFNASSTSADINSNLLAFNDDDSPVDKSTLISTPGTYVGACGVGETECHMFTVNVNHFTKYKILEKTQVAPTTNSDGSATAEVNSETPEVVVASSTQPLIVNVSSGTNATVNYDALITGGMGVIPQTTIDTESADIIIPAATTVTSASTTWNGIMAAPRVTTVTLPPTAGQTKTLSSAIEVGFSGAKLSFDKGVRILMAGQANKRAGYTRSGEGFTEITTPCAEDSQTWADGHLVADEECKINSGSDLVIWTRHFTTFATYTQTTNTTSGGGGGSVPAPNCTDVTYSEWGTSFNGIQYRNILSQTPANCSLTADQRAAQSRPLASVIEPVKTEITPATEQVSEPAKQVLGVKKYADGTLLRGADKKTYVVVAGKLKYISSLSELAKYRGTILRVTDETIASFSKAASKTAVLGVKKYANGTLLRGSDKKVYVLVNGKKQHVRSLQALIKYTGKPILDVEDGVVSQY